MTSTLQQLRKATPLKLIESGPYTSTETGTGVDLQAYEGAALAVLNSSAGDDADATLNAKLQDCATVGGTYVDITGATFVEVDDTAGGSIQAIAIDAGTVKQFVRAVGTLAGATPAFNFGISLLGQKKYE